MFADTSGGTLLKTSARSERWREAGVRAPGGASSVPPLLHGCCWAEVELNSQAVKVGTVKVSSEVVGTLKVSSEGVGTLKVSSQACFHFSTMLMD